MSHGLPAARPLPLRASASPLALAAHLLVAGMAAAVAAPAAHAQAAATVQYDVPSGPLAQALGRFAQQSGIAVAVEDAQVQGIQSPGVRGAYTVEQGFGVLLRDTGFAAARTAAGYVLVPVPPAPAATVTLAPVTVTAHRQGPDANGAGQAAPSLPSVTVKGEQDQRAYPGGQVAPKARIGVLGEVDYMSSPFSTTSYTREFVENRLLTNVMDILVNDPAASTTFTTSTPAVDGLRIRGFQTQTSDDTASVNGLQGILGFMPPAVSALERVTLIKGPNAFLNGSVGSVGGSVALEMKRAEDLPTRTVTGTYIGSSVLGAQFDLGQRFGEDRALGVRLNGLRNQGDTRVKGAKRDESAVSLGLDYRSRDLRIEADYAYRKLDFGAQQYFTAIAAGVPLVAAPDGRTPQQPPWIKGSSELSFGMVKAAYDLAADWTVSAAFGKSRSYNLYTGYCFATVLDVSGLTRCVGSPVTSSWDKDAANVAVHGSVDTGPVKHRLAFGGNLIDLVQASQPNLPGFTQFTYNLYAPVFPASNPAPGIRKDRLNRSSHARTHSLFVSDTLSFLDDRLSVMLGIRRTTAEQQSYNIVTGVRTAAVDNAANTPSAGVVVKLTPNWSVYGNAIQALERGGIAPATAANAGQVFPALVSRQVEAGVKFDHGSLGGTLAAYRIRKANQYTDARTNTYAQDGRQENIGVEATAFGEPASGVRLLAGVAALNARLKSTSGGAFDGKRAPAVPRTELRVSGEFDVSAVPGLALGASVQRSGAAPLDNANTYSVPAWTRLDLSARYAFDAGPVRWTARLGIENATDRKYWIAGGAGYVALGAPRTAVASLTAAF